MSKVGGAAGSAPGPTAAAAAAAVQKQKSLLQKADADVSSLVDNFSSLINIARVNDPPVRNSQEAFQMEMRAARMMASLNGNHEDKDNERNTNVSPAASSFECKMLEYMAAQTQTLQAMAQTMINIHQYITEEATSSKNHNPVSGNNHQIPSVPPPFDKEKLSNMQAQVLQGQKQTNTSPPCNTEMTKAGVPTGPVKKQVVEAWNNQKNKRSHGVPEMLMKKQHEVINTIVTCRCCEYYGHSCLQEETSLMTPKARQRYLLDINRKRKLSTQDPAPEGVAMNLEDWSISFKEYQPVRSKQSKKQTSKAIQEKKELSHTMADSTTQPSSNRPQPKVVQPPHNISISENTNAKAIPPRAMVEQEGSQDGCLAISFKQRDILQQCCNRSKSGHHTRRCPTKQNVDKSQWSCHNCGKGLLAEQCPLNQEYRKKSLNALAREGCCGETVQSPKRSKLSISRKQEQFGGDVYEKVDK